MKQLRDIDSSPDALYSGLCSNAEKHRFYNLYSSMDRVMCLLLTGCFYVSNGSKWNDKRDRELMRPINKYGKSFSCSTMENIAMWMLYSGDKGKHGAMLKIPNSTMLEILRSETLEPGRFDSETGAFISSGAVLHQGKDFSMELIDIVYYEELKDGKNGTKRVRLTLGEDHDCADKRILDESKVFYKRYEWSYEKECRLIVTLNDTLKAEDWPFLRIKLSEKARRELRDRVYRSPVYKGTDFGTASKLTGDIDWNL